MHREQLAVTHPAELQATATPHVYRVTLIRAGLWPSKRLECPAAVLAAAVPLFAGRPCFLNPPPPQAGGHGYPDLRDYVGLIDAPEWDDAAEAITAQLRLAATPAAAVIGPLLESYLADRAEGRAVPDIGLSAVLWLSAAPGQAGQPEAAVRTVAEIHAVDQVDAVYRPAAGGSFDQVLGAEPPGHVLAAEQPATRAAQAPLAAAQPADASAAPAPPAAPPPTPIQETDPMPDNLPPTITAPGVTPPVAPASPSLAAEERPTAGGRVSNAAGVATAAPPPEPTNLAAPPPATGPTPAAAETLLSEQRAVLDSLRSNLLDMRLAASNLPAHLQTLVRESLPSEATHGRPWTTADLEATISRIQAAWSQEESHRTVRGVGPISLTDGLDQITEALSALIEGRPPARGVAPLSGIREAYIHLSGDYEMTGLYHGERVSLANVNSTTMANIVANVLNKVVVAEFQTYPRWWAPIVLSENFNTLQTVKWIILGGIGELPAISEGAAYNELTWDDASESVAWQKRGGYLGLTIEAMDKDDTARLRTAPRALAQAAWLTLGKSVSAIFTQSAGVGPLLADTKALFHADHGNLGTAALSNTSWAAAKLAMRKQTEVNSGERLGALTSPRYLLIPPDLENTALTVLSSENLPGVANNDVNPEASGNTYDARRDAARRRIIVVDLWTDANDWALVADPRLYPTIGLGFRYGETPEIFSIASPTSGLMFSNDVMPIKVRWFYACGPMDYRGLYKANVA